MEEDRMPKKIFTRELERTRRRGRPRKRWKERSRKSSSSAGSEKMENDGDRQKKMEGYCSTGQSLQRAVVQWKKKEKLHSFRLLENNFKHRHPNVNRCKAPAARTSVTHFCVILPYPAPDLPSCNSTLSHWTKVSASHKNRRHVMDQISPLTPKLNPSTQRCLPRFFTGDFNF
jgi:hypothetical protein